MNETRSVRGKNPAVNSNQESRLFGWSFFAQQLIYLGVFQLFLMTPFAKQSVIGGIHATYASACASILRWLGESTYASGVSIYSLRFAVTIKEGCDALLPKALFIASVLASPVSWKGRVVGVVFGVCFLVLLNMVRLISLYYVGFHSADFFEFFHHDVWQPLLIIASLGAWATWAVWARRINQ